MFIFTLNLFLHAKILKIAAVAEPSSCTLDISALMFFLLKEDLSMVHKLHSTNVNPDER